MKGISKTAHAGFSPLIPAVLVPPEVFTQAPPGFIPPPLNPSWARLETKELAPGVFGLLSSKPPVDNSGFVVGERGVLRQRGSAIQVMLSLGAIRYFICDYNLTRSAAVLG